MTFDIHFEGV